MNWLHIRQAVWRGQTYNHLFKDGPIEQMLTYFFFHKVIFVSLKKEKEVLSIWIKNNKYSREWDGSISWHVASKRKMIKSMFKKFYYILIYKLLSIFIYIYTCNSKFHFLWRSRLVYLSIIYLVCLVIPVKVDIMSTFAEIT